MSRRILIEAAGVQVAAELNGTKTAQAIWGALPMQGYVNIWGDEIYFSVPIILALDNGQELVGVGDLGYWPQGHAFCIFFGPTPVSKRHEIRPASAVNVFGKIIGDAAVFRQVPSGTEITVERDTEE